MIATQFLGAFNDNVFKQVVLLLCVEFYRQSEGADIYQSLAQAIFAIPFVVFSGFAGFLSDRTSKRTIVVLAKIAEIGVMLAGMFVFLMSDAQSVTVLYGLFAVLFCMSVQSAFFGPAKYGILPEMLREGDLPAANGIMQMTTFLAIIFGTAVSGIAKQGLSANQLWVINAFCVSIAIAGTMTSLLVRKTPVAHPGLEFRISTFGVNQENWKLLQGDRTLRGVLFVAALFWFLGGVILPTVNAFGKSQMEFNDRQTSFLVACVGIGIAFGCLLSGKLSRHRVRFGLVTIGTWGMIGSFVALSWLGVSGLPGGVVLNLGFVGLISLGFFSGIFVVPLQVFLQIRPPKDQKGRMIGTMNLVTWIGILLSAPFYYACSKACTSLNIGISWTFLITAVLMVPLGLFYRPSVAGSPKSIP